MSGKRSRAETVEDLEFLDGSGASAVDAAVRLGFASAQSMCQWLRDNDAYDLWISLHARDPEKADLGRRVQTPPAAPATGIESILMRAEKSPRPRLVKRATKIRELAETLSDDLDAVEATDAAREAARREVEQLERQLADAKAKLRGAAKPEAVEPARRANVPKGEYPCRNEGCGVMYDTPQGRSMHERMHCEHREEVVA